MTITIEQQIQAVKREIGLRQGVYPRFVAAKRMSQEKADHELAAMQAVLRTLEGLLGADAAMKPAHGAQEAK